MVKTLGEKTCEIRLNELRARLNGLRVEWAFHAENSKQPQTRKWYRYFAAELSRELKKFSEDLVNIQAHEVR